MLNFAMRLLNPKTLNPNSFWCNASDSATAHLFAAGEQLTAQRLALLNFTAAAGVAPGEVLLHYIVAAADSADAAGRVAARGESLLRKRCGVDSSKPAVDLESAALVRLRIATPENHVLKGVHPSKMRPPLWTLRCRAFTCFTFYTGQRMCVECIAAQAFIRRLLHAG